MITRDLLRSLRNDLPMAFTFQQLGSKAPYSKRVEGRLRFQCPNCKEILAAINPRNNLGHCFYCKRNINNIDLLIQCGYEFLDAVTLLKQWLHLYSSQTAARAVAEQQAASIDNPHMGAIGPILRQEFGNHAPRAE